jgi:uncharacterized protein (TIGR02466 family)
MGRKTAVTDKPAKEPNAGAPVELRSTEARVELRSYFATPLAVVELPMAAALNPELRETILARERASGGVKASNLGGWQSSWDLPAWGGQAAEAVLGTARALADRLTCDRQGQAVQIAWKMNAWANVNRSGHANEFHTHPGSYWSATYYVDDGGIAADPSLGGEFEIQDPRGVAPAMYAPLLAFAVPGGQSSGASELVRPKAGTLVMFPAWLSHGVRPYRGTATRISIAMNLSL